VQDVDSEVSSLRTDAPLKEDIIKINLEDTLVKKFDFVSKRGGTMFKPMTP
jgi:hypothetical protein